MKMDQNRIFIWFLCALRCDGRHKWLCFLRFSHKKEVQRFAAYISRLHLPLAGPMPNVIRLSATMKLKTGNKGNLHFRTRGKRNFSSRKKCEIGAIIYLVVGRIMAKLCCACNRKTANAVNPIFGGKCSNPFTLMLNRNNFERNTGKLQAENGFQFTDPIVG